MNGDVYLKIYEMINYITPILIQYYMTYRNIYFTYDDKFVNEIKQSIYINFERSHPNDINEDIICINLLWGPFEKEYSLLCDNKCHISIKDTLVDISQEIYEYFKYINYNYFIISPRNNIISFNFVPFDGFTIYHDFIIKLIDTYIY